MREALREERSAIMTRTNHLTILDSDIICGRGKGFDRYEGNQIFRDVIKEYSSTYVGYRTNRTGKSRVIRKILDDIVGSRNMRFVKHVKKKGWVLLKESEIKLKIGHALRDVEPVRQKQVRRKETKRTTRKETPATAQELAVPAENTQARVVHNNDVDHGSLDSPGDPTQEEQPSRQEESDTRDCDEASFESAVSHAEANSQSWQGEKQVKNVDTCPDGLSPATLYNGLNQLLRLECTSSHGKPSVYDQVDPLLLTNNFCPTDKDNHTTACISPRSSLNLEAGGANSVTFDATLAVVFLDFMEGGDVDDSADLADVQPTEWV